MSPCMGMLKLSTYTMTADTNKYVQALCKQVIGGLLCALFTRLHQKASPEMPNKKGMSVVPAVQALGAGCRWPNRQLTDCTLS